MKKFRSLSELFEARRKGASISEVFIPLLKAPELWMESGISPFSVLYNLYDSDRLNLDNQDWKDLPHEEQEHLAKAYQWWYAHGLGYTNIYRTLEDSADIQLALIPPMNDQQPFWISVFEITQAQWNHIMSASMSYHVDPSRPVTNVTPFQCEIFCDRMGGRLPTTKEWELAARSGVTTRYPRGDNPYTKENLEILKKRAVYQASESSIPGTKEPNAFGLYDMLGNVFEFAYEQTKSKKKIYYMEGGSWFHYASSCSFESILTVDVDTENFDIGLRLVIPFHKGGSGV